MTGPKNHGVETEAEIDVLLAFADDEHLMGQQHTEWIGVAPFLEEDLAFASIGQDELGHAVMLYELVLELRDTETSDLEIDRLAYRRGDDEYRSAALVEFPTNDWAEALVRHWIYDTVEARRWSLLEGSANESLRAITASALREESYHLRHANALVDSLLIDPEGRSRLDAALDVILPLVPGLLHGAAGEPEAIASSFITGSLADLAGEIATAISERFERPVSLPASTDGEHDRAQRSDAFGPLMTRMREVLDYDPEASW